MNIDIMQAKRGMTAEYKIRRNAEDAHFENEIDIKIMEQSGHISEEEAEELREWNDICRGRTTGEEKPQIRRRRRKV